MRGAGRSARTKRRHPAEPRAAISQAWQGVLPAALAIAAGVSLVVQQVLNGNLRTALGSAAWSGFMSYFVGVLCMALLALALRDPVPLAGLAARIPWRAWSG